jgi:CheY-like chemotaxis protein
VLTDEGHRVLIAMNGRQGLELLNRERPDLVFLDYMMPVMDGAGMLRGMEADPSLQAIPVVLMSSMPEATVAERCFGYTRFMRKPFRLNQLVALTESLIGNPAA